MIGTLMRKDWRLNRTVVVGSLVLSVLPYGVALVTQWLFSDERETTHGEYVNVIEASAAFCLSCMTLIAGVYGGVAFAAERRERSAEFLAMLPVTRGRIMLSKLAVAVACFAPVWAVHVAVLARCGQYEDVRMWLTVGTLVGLAAFCVAWAASTFLSSAALAAIIGLCVTGAVVFVIAFATASLRNEHQLTDATLFAWIRGATFILSIVFLLGGSIYYHGRVRP